MLLPHWGHVKRMVLLLSRFTAMSVSLFYKYHAVKYNGRGQFYPRGDENTEEYSPLKNISFLNISVNRINFYLFTALSNP